MEKYHKIQTVFNRDPQNKYKSLLMGNFAKPEFEYLQGSLWQFTEKIDGMNIRIDYDGEGVTCAGRTDKAEIPGPLVEKLSEIVSDIVMGDVLNGPVTLYGEGFGGSIQKGGEYGDQDFALFDVLAKDVWLDRAAVKSIANGLGIKYAPVVLWGRLGLGIHLAKEGFQSAFGDHPQAEGLVMRPAVELKNKYGERVIAKIKCKDFRK